ncbi:MAG: hypothetical protein GY953_25830, partial [bacterium]|nr:hypothetical protein [bacterium]
MPVRRGTIRFGAFEVNPVAGELRKGGVKIKIQDLPFRILTILLERSGEVVTREELRQKLWAEDEFVEFEHSLNTAVNKLRSALGDSADQPRYIETIPRRGYRFVGVVDAEPARAASGRSPKLALWIAAGIAIAAAASGLTYWFTKPAAS